MTFRPSYRRPVVIFVCGVILFALVRQANHVLAPWGVSLWCGGLAVAFPALRLSPQQGFNACFLLGLLLDATSPLPFGCNAFLFGVAQLAIVRVRNRFAAGEVLTGIAVAWVANLACYLTATFVALGTAAEHVSGLRILTDLLFSQIAVGLLAPWFFALQERALNFARIGLQDEPSAAI